MIGQSERGGDLFGGEFDEELGELAECFFGQFVLAVGDVPYDRSGAFPSGGIGTPRLAGFYRFVHFLDGVDAQRLASEGDQGVVLAALGEESGGRVGISGFAAAAADSETLEHGRVSVPECHGEAGSI